MTVRYEDIVADYQSEMKKVLSFIGEEYVSEIDKYPETATLQKSSAWFKTARQVDAGSVRRWKKAEHRNVVDELMDMPGAVGLLKYYGYLE